MVDMNVFLTTRCSLIFACSMCSGHGEEGEQTKSIQVYRAFYPNQKSHICGSCGKDAKREVSR